MKKFLIATILLLCLNSIPIHAQEDTVERDATVGIQIEQEKEANEQRTEEEEKADVTTLSQELQIKRTDNISFLTILFAVLTPALLIAVAYLLIKMSNK